MTRVLFAIAATILAASAAFGFQNPLRDRLIANDRQQETVGWYQRVDTGGFFLLDRTADIALLKERDEADAEVLVLYPDRAAGGGTAYMTDMGREVVRLTGLGGLTYFPGDRPDGVIAEYASPAGAMTPRPRNSDEVRLRAQELARYLSGLFDRPLSVVYRPVPRAGLGMQFETLDNIQRAFYALRNERRRYRDLQRVQIITGPQIAAYMEDDTLVVVIVPEAGHAGRPSSAFIAEAVRLGQQPS